MKKIFQNNRGFTLPFVAVVAFGLMILILSVVQSTKINTGHMLHFKNMNRVFRLAESGTSVTLGVLSIDPSTTAVNGVPVVIPGEGEYQCFATAISTPVIGTFYVVTSATRTVGGKTYSTKLHTYASVANVGDYFAALQNSYIFSPGMNASGGKVYAPNVTFLVSTGVASATKALEVEYVASAVAQNALAAGQQWFPSQWASQGPAGTPVAVNEVLIGTDTLTTKLPTQLSTLRTFPQVTTSDLSRYLGLAGVHTLKQVFTGDIFPPGYMTPGCAPLAGDLYPQHTCANADHVYYSSSDITLGGAGLTTTIHGQILFVSEKNIIINGNVVNDTSTTFPGDGYTSSSTAHQAVLVTRQNVVVNTSSWAAANSTATVHAFMFAPNGQLFINPASVVNPGRNFNFLGSQILADTAPPPNNLPSQFTGTRSYAYMTTLATNPPPYLPALTIIFYSFEDVTGSASLF